MIKQKEITMKKLLTILFVVIATFCTAFAFTACDLFGGNDNSSEENGSQTGDNSTGSGSTDTGNSGTHLHTHSYVWKINEQTSDTGVNATGMCACGDTQTRSFPALTDSRYIKSKDTATCTEDGQIKYTIHLEDEKYILVAETKATGVHSYSHGVCSGCGASDPNYVPHTHNYVEMSDETGHWQVCECGVCSTVVPHSFTVGKDDGYHWKVCTVKGEIIEKEEHTFTDFKCSCGAELDRKGVKAIAIQHTNGEGKYLWNAGDVEDGKYDLYDATLKITHNDDTVSFKPVTVDMLDSDINLTAGNHNITVSYEGKEVALSVFVAPEDGLIEAVVGKSEITGIGETLTFNLSSKDGINNENINIKGMFNVSLDGEIYNGYYGETPVNERFLQDFDPTKEGIQECKIVAGNISASPAVLGDLNVMSYKSVDVSEEEVFVSGITVIKIADNSVAQHFDLVPGKPYLDIDKVEFYSSDYKLEFQFAKGTFTNYSGGTDTAVTVTDIAPFDPASNGYKVSGDIGINCVNWYGEYLIRLASKTGEITVAYTTYSSSNTNIRFCRVHNVPILEYELKDGFTLDNITKDLLTKELYVEYFEKVDGKFVHLVPVEESMIDYDRVDVNSYNHQSGTITFSDKGIGINIVRARTVEGANVLYTLNNTAGLRFLLSEATVNDLSKGIEGDLCKKIVLYDNGAAKVFIGNIGELIMGYELNGNNLTLLRYGLATTYLTANLTNNTFEKLDISSATAGAEKKTYSYYHDYELGGDIPVGWSATFTAYKGDTGYPYCWYAEVHLTGWASSVNEDGYAYQIAGMDYLASWALGWHNNTNALVVRFADYDWWFIIGTADDTGTYRLEFFKKVLAS